MSPIVTVLDEDELKAFPSKISNIIKLRVKGLTPAKPPRVLIFHHPGRTELRALIKNVAVYFDLKNLSVESTLVDQREKLEKLGSNCHELLTKMQELPDDVDFANEIATAFMEHELSSTTCSSKGWLMTNYPKNKEQLAQFLKLKQEPCIVGQGH